MRVLTRHDVAPLHLESTLDWALDSLKTSTNTFEVGFLKL